MRVKLPLLRTHYDLSPARAPVLRYGVALLSIVLALIPAFLLTDVVESRLLVFAVAVMVSAWYGGWKPGLAATSFALTVSGYFAVMGDHSPDFHRKAFIDLALFFVVAILICWGNYALRSVQDGLRRSELNFRSLVTNAPYAICRCDARGVVLDANPVLVQMLGYASTEEIAGENLANLHRDSQEWFTVADCLRSLQPFKDLTAEWVRKDGKQVLVRLSGRAICNGAETRGSRQALSFELFAEDITERRALEQQLRHAQKMEAVGRLAGGIAHDFNNLLMVISGYCEFLIERVSDDGELRNLAQEISRAAERAAGLTRQLLAFSRKQMFAPKVLDLNSVVTENLKMLTRVIGEDIDLAMVPGASLGSVKADPSQIEQVVMNLAVNARDAMPHGGKLTIETSNITLDESYTRIHTPVKPGEYVMLAISDTGVGMDAETQAQIFEPFYTTKGTKGTGLGLSTVYGIVKQSEGYIWVYSEPDKGTTFKIYLPRVTPSGEPVPVQPAVAEPAAGPFRETILLVEDENTLRSITRQYLTRQGYTVLEANNGVSALRLSATHPGPIHLLLTDVIMPGMNGRELADRLKAVRPESKVLYMSGYTENAIGHNGVLEAGTNLLQKPFTLPALKAKVREVIDTPLPQEAFMAARTFVQSHIRVREKVSPFRAQRFNLHLPMKYRPLGEQDWREGTTANISRSGLLFEADEKFAPNAQLEINLVLPVEIAGLSAAEVVCRGEVVRSQETGEKAANTLAAKILQYRFQHGSSQAAHA
jgi:PAS domain S-box-containing protein